jgi:hypothetical protein
MLMAALPIELGDKLCARRWQLCILRDEVKDIARLVNLDRIKHGDLRPVGQFQNTAVTRLAAAGCVKDGAVELNGARR